jgi:pimeloyl-ACP methyl ester carboxylesterase
LASVPKSYVVCSKDQTIPPEAQRQMAARAGATVHELDTSHSPFLSRPDLVAELIRDTVRTSAEVRS